MNATKVSDLLAKGRAIVPETLSWLFRHVRHMSLGDVILYAMLVSAGWL